MFSDNKTNIEGIFFAIGICDGVLRTIFIDQGKRRMEVLNTQMHLNHPTTCATIPLSMTGECGERWTILNSKRKALTCTPKATSSSLKIMRKEGRESSTSRPAWSGAAMNKVQRASRLDSWAPFSPTLKISHELESLFRGKRKIPTSQPMIDIRRSLHS